MKKKLALILLSLMCVSCIATAMTPIRFCVFPEVAIPGSANVYGLNFGLVTGNKIPAQKIYGLDLAALGSVAKMDGFQTSLFCCMSKGSNSVQLAAVNVGDDFGGVQVGCFNGTAEDSKAVQVGAVNGSSKSESVQIGIINAAEKSECVQVGLINIMDNGFIPVCPILNFSID